MSDMMTREESLERELDMVKDELAELKETLEITEKDLEKALEALGEIELIARKF